MAIYTDNKGKQHEISEDGLETAARYKTELQRENGRANWGKVARLLRKDGYDAKPCEGFRQAVKKYQRKTGTLKTSAQQLSNELEHRRSALDKELDEMLLEKRELQLMRREFNKSKRDYADMGLFKRDVKLALKDGITITPTVSERVPRPTSDGNALVVCLSDLHIGARVDIDGYYYDEHVAKDLLNKYADRIVEYINFYKPDKLYVMGLGDYVEGAYMRANQAYEITLALSSQINTAIKLVSEFIIDLAGKTGVPVIYSGITGNHDRANGNKVDCLTNDNFAVVLNEAVKMIVEHVPYDITVEEPDKITENHISVNGANIKFVHGDLHNLSKQTVLSSASQFDGILYDAIVGGHLHSLLISENAGLIVQSGSLIGPNSYSEKLHCRSSRSQVVLSVSPSGVITPLPILL